ncbi:MAG: hypothetical protein H7Y27_08840, partial [Gemmatimonadaceae bacterium]|nr:hypothetical protein [Chitinophagaceae bacterium]
LDNGAVVYESDITAIGQFTIVISKIDSIGVSGTFSGKVKDSNGNPKDVVNGKFNAKFKTSAVTPPAGDGQLTLWSKAGCSPGATAIQVSVNGSNGTITSFQAAEPACATAGTYTVTLPAGTYTWTATCGAVTITGSVTVTAGGCTRGQVDFTAPVATNCKISNIILYDGSGDAEYAYKASYTGNLVTKWEAIDSISNTVDAAFNLTRPAGKIQLDANQYLVVNGNGRVTEFRGYEDPRDPNSLPIIVKYTYNGNGQLTQRTEELQQLPGQVYFTFTYTWSGNLLTKVQGKTGNQLFYEDVYEYDALKTVKNGIILHSFAAEIFMLQSVANFGVAPDKAFTKITQKTFDPLQGTILTTSIATFDQYVIDAAGFVQSFRLNDAALEGLGFGVMPTGTYKLFYNCP